MKSAIIPVLVGLLSSGVMAGEAIAKSAPQGSVTIQEIPVVMVQTKRWNSADEAAYKAVVKTEAAKSGRELSYAAR